MIRTPAQLSRLQQVSLVLLRTLIGWHFLYEGYFKLLRPAWTRAGAPLAGWTSADYLNAASGPLAWIFRAAAGSSWLPWIDTLVAAALVAVGLLLILGLYTQAACTGALLLLALFYLSAIPTRGLPEPRSEGAYLFVNKNLVEAIAMLVVLAFRTGRIAGLDRLRAQYRDRSAPLRTDEALV